MPDINININVNADGEIQEPEIKRKDRKLKNGKESVLELPERTEGVDQPKGVLQMLGL